jgi:chemotaxis protein CheY-P-specific phosphatase CheC
MFEGGFSGLVAMNFSAQAALEIYRRYNLNMGIPEKELASYHTSQEVADAMGELMNQSVGRFQVDLKKQIGIGVNQSQPKMVALNQAMRIALEAEVDRPQYRRVEFRTNHNNLFYVEITTEKVEFIVDSKLIEETNQWLKQNLENTDKMSQSKSMPNQADEDFMQKLGL